MVSTEIGIWVDPRLQATGRRPWRKVHLDFHNTPAVGAIGTDFDAEEFVASLRRGHVDAIVVFAKDMHGYFYYPAARADAVREAVQHAGRAHAVQATGERPQRHSPTV